MFNMGIGELIVVGMIALIFIGPRQLPEVARALAKMINEIKRAVGDVSSSFKKNRTNVDDWMKDLTTHIVNSQQQTPPSISPDPHAKTHASVTPGGEKDEKKS
jgi:Tat protein translocase TatB subunit